MAQTLNPQLDVVFKLLFAAKKNRALLVALLNDVLQPPTPIVSASVLDPEIEKEIVEDRGLLLDITAVHDDGTRTDIEMQAKNRGATERRALYHWARLYRDGLQRGGDFESLTPCRVIFFLSFTLFKNRNRLHSTFRVLEAHELVVLSDDLELHFVELTKLAKNPIDADDDAADWARFLAAKSDQERRELSMANEDIRRANEALEVLSQDPKAQDIARRREDQLRLQRMEMAALEKRYMEKGMRKGIKEGVKKGVKKGMRKGIEEGVKEGQIGELLETLRQLCEVFEIELGPPREANVATMGVEDLRALKQHLLTHRCWPEP